EQPAEAACSGAVSGDADAVRRGRIAAHGLVAVAEHADALAGRRVSVDGRAGSGAARDARRDTCSVRRARAARDADPGAGRTVTRAQDARAVRGVALAVDAKAAVTRG